MTSAILKSVNYKNTLYKNLILIKNNAILYQNIKVNFDAYLNILKNIIKEQKKRLLFLKLINNSYNFKNTTNLPNKCIHNNSIYNNDVSIANGFNDYFINIRKVLLSDITISPAFQNVNEYITTLPSQTNTFNFVKIKEDDILHIINSLKNTNSSGVDNISNKAVKKVKYLILSPLTMLINQSLDTVFSPDKLKIVKKLNPYLKK